jgi:hypothetical protein
MTLRSFFVASSLFFGSYTLLFSQQAAQNSARAANESVQVPGTPVTIIPPTYFELSTQFQGFIHLPTASTIQISVLDTIPFMYMRKGFTNEELISQGATPIQREEVKTAAGDPALLIVFGFTANEHEFERIMLITGDYQRSVILNANYPVLGRENLHEVLKQSVLSVQLK